jgi:hypothetical protein
MADRRHHEGQTEHRHQNRRDEPDRARVTKLGTGACEHCPDNAECQRKPGRERDGRTDAPRSGAGKNDRHQRENAWIEDRKRASEKCES